MVNSPLIRPYLLGGYLKEFHDSRRDPGYCNLGVPCFSREGCAPPPSLTHWESVLNKTRPPGKVGLGFSWGHELLPMERGYNIYQFIIGIIL